jgi:hypothetical protein
MPMKTKPGLPSLLLVTAMICLAHSCSKTSDLDFYELKIYRFESDVQEARLDQYLASAYLPALHRAGVDQVGVFKPREEGNDTDRVIMILAPFTSPGSYMELPDKLRKDQVYLEAGRDYIESPHNDPPYTRIEILLLKAFRSTPHLSIPDLDSPRPDRVYELRSYQAATELLYERKVEMFNKGESALFEKLGFRPVFFGEVISSSRMPHLMYMTVHADTSAQKDNWDAFVVHPDWEEMKGLERYKNTVSDITRYLLYPTPYSDY